MSSVKEKTLEVYNQFLNDLTNYMKLTHKRITKIKYVDCWNDRKNELSAEEKKKIVYNLNKMNIHITESTDVSIKMYKQSLLNFTRPNETDFPKLSKIVNRINGLWLRIIRFLFTCNFIDFSIFFSTSEYMEILNMNEKVLEKYFFDLLNFINNGSKNEVRIFFDYLYEDVLDSRTFKKAYDIEFSRAEVRKNSVEKQRFCPYCELHETSTGNSQIDHFIPRKIALFFSIFSHNLIVSCPECNGTLVKSENFHTPILHPYFDIINENIRYYINYDGVIKIHALKNKNPKKAKNFVKQFKIIERLNASTPFDNKKKKRIFEELSLLEKQYLDNPENFEEDIDKLYSFAISEVEKKEEFYVKIVSDILPLLKNENSFLRKNIANLSIH